MTNDETVEEIEISVVKGVEGISVYIDDFRIAGSKPWGGGNVLKTFTVPIGDFCRIYKLDIYYRKKLEKQLIGDWFFDSFFNFIAIEFPGLYENFTREVKLKIIKHLMINIKKVL